MTNLPDVPEDLTAYLDFESETPCNRCGHAWALHSFDAAIEPGCVDGWEVGTGSMAGRWVEGPDACTCASFQEPT